MKNLDLDHLGLTEITKSELREIDGGFFGLDDFLVAVTAGAVIAVINDWDNFERGLSGKPYQK